MGLECLLLHKCLEADVALVGTDAGVDQHVPLHVGLQGKLPPAHLALELLHALQGVRRAVTMGQSQDLGADQQQAELCLQWWGPVHRGAGWLWGF